MPSKAEAICGSICAFIFLPALILFSSSFSPLTPLEMGIAMKTSTQVLDSSQTYGSGRRFVGVGRTFIPFPVTYQTIQLGDFYPSNTREGRSVKCRSSDGMTIKMDVSFSYILSRKPEDLIRLYRDMENKERWHAFYTSIAKASTRDVTAKYSAFDFFIKRQEIAEALKDHLNKALSRVYASVQMYELTNMEFHNSFATSIETTQVAIQDILQAAAERDVATINADSDLDVKTKQAEVKRAKAQAESAVIVNRASTEAQALEYAVARQIEGYKTLAASLNLTSAAELLRYQYITALQDNAAGSFLANLPYPTGMQIS
jgi:regulator of protease activity HflC (stomatin/prohibitin superfamily)